MHHVRTNAELTALHIRGAGLIFNHFTSGSTAARDNVLHAAGCVWVGRMLDRADPHSRPSVRKIYFDTVGEAQSWLVPNLGREDRGWKLCRRCRPDLPAAGDGRQRTGTEVTLVRRADRPFGDADVERCYLHRSEQDKSGDGVGLDRATASESPAMRELADGVAYWQNFTTWPADFHNSDYAEWVRQRPSGHFTLGWWRRYQLPRLTQWIATRPCSGEILTARFEDRIADLSAAWEEACLPHLSDDISTVTWDIVKVFPDVVAGIKPMKTAPSAVFTSKFCHFLLPKIFPVVDNAALGGWRTYETYFKRVQAEWESTGEAIRAELRAELTRLIEANGQPLFAEFPMINKIVEFRLIGRRHRRSP
jgi:hypothetical protein